MQILNLVVLPSNNQKQARFASFGINRKMLLDNSIYSHKIFKSIVSEALGDELFCAYTGHRFNKTVGGIMTVEHIIPRSAFKGEGFRQRSIEDHIFAGTK